MNIIKNEFPVEVTYLDGSHGRVGIKLPPLRDMARYLQLLDDDAAMVEMLTGLDRADVDQITDESVFRICDEAAHIMHPRVAAWVDRQAAKTESYAPILGKARAKIEATATSPGRPSS